MLRIKEGTYERMPPHLQALFKLLPNHGSDEVLKAFPDRDGFSSGGRRDGLASDRAMLIGLGDGGAVTHFGDNGSAARFFYTAKADAEDRIGSKHPTVKPVDLMQWLVRLVTPKGGTVLDPFAGTGTTGEAAWREGMRAVLIEREPEYQADIARRLETADKPLKRADVIKRKPRPQADHTYSLFDTPEAAE